jgi:UDP-glucose 4-epimerase
MPKVLVTGGAGFIGGHLVDRLVRLGYDVLVLDNFSTGSYRNPSADYEACDVSAYKPNDYQRIFDKYEIDSVFHLAAQINLRNSFDDPVMDAQTNMIGTMALAASARSNGVNKFVFASTGGAIYSESTEPPWTEQSPVGPQSPYGMSKMCAENYLKMLLPTSTILRFSNVYGPRQNPHGEAGVVSIFMDNIRNNRPCRIFGDGTQIRDYVYVDDVVDACICAKKYEMDGVYNVSTGVGTDLNSLTLLMLSLSGKNAMVKYEAAKPGEMKKSILSPSKLTMARGWWPKVKIQEGLQKTVQWFLEE